MNKKEDRPKALQHQREGTAFLKSRSAAGLFDEQGLGKTKQLIDAINESMTAGQLDGAVVVCPNHLKTTWADEIARHAPGTVTVVLGSGKTARRRALRNLRGRYYLVNYEAVAREAVVLQALLRFKRFALVLDESHRIKAPDTGVTRAVHNLRQYAARRYILSGTPVANKPEDIWSQVYFLDDGKSLGTSHREFARRYGGGHSGYVNLDDLCKRLESLAIRRTKATHLSLPTKSYHRVTVPLGPKQAQMYRKMREETRLWVQSLTGEQVLQQADGILARLVRLVQLASNPALLDASYSEVPSKFKVLDELVRKYLSTDPKKKLIVWSSFVENVNSLKRRYADYGAVAIHGGLSRDRRERSIAEFKRNQHTRVLVANPAAAREGLTLTQATVAVYLDRSFNLVDYLQSQDRIHRIGQADPCEIILLVAPRTVDEYVDFVLEQKGRVARFIQGDTRALDLADSLFQKPAIIAALLR